MTNITTYTILMTLKAFFMAVWKFISYLFWPQKADKNRYS